MTQVRSVRAKRHEKIVTLLSPPQNIEIRLPRFAAIAPHDDINVKGLTNKKVWLQDRDNSNDAIQILPVFSRTESIAVGGRELNATFSEIDSEAKYEAYLALERFHYRSNPSLVDQGREDLAEAAGGRKAVLIASIQLGKRTEYIGYIELGMPLMMVAPRHRAFNRPFRHSQRDVHWPEWDQHALKKYLNLIVRIARVVTHPTFRGIGLAGKLVSIAEQFARERWHIQRQRPMFIEISAEMLNYFDFVSKLGFVYCGRTDGNYKRIARDMRAMQKGQKITSGIMTLQNKYYAALSEYAELRGISVDSAINDIERIAESDDPESLVDDQSWLLLRRIFRSPRPYFIKGMDEDAHRYLRGVSIPTPADASVVRARTNVAIEISNLVVTATVDLPASSNVKVVKDAFGLVGAAITQKLLAVMAFRATSGNIFLLAGASGTGKSIFLDVLGMKDRPLHPNIFVSFEQLEVPKTAKLASIDPDCVLIDYFAKNYGLRESMKTLATVGLSEAVPMVKPFWMLSKGQRYRALLADLLLRKASVWLLDEFGADLDPITAGVLASKLRSIADATGVVIFVAAANNGHFYSALRPTRVLAFDIGVEPRILKTQEFENELFEKAE